MIVSYLPLIAGLVSIILGVLVVVNGTTRASTRWPFAVFAMSVGVWAIFISFFLLTEHIRFANAFVVIYYIAALLISYSFMIFGLTYSLIKVSKLVMVLALLPWLALSVAIIIPGFFIQSIDLSGANTVSLVTESYLIYGALFVCYVGIGLGALVIRALRSRRRNDKHRRILAITMTISLLGGGFFNLLLPGLNNYSLIAWGPIFTFVMVASVFYVIARHGLFDIRLAVVRTVAYAASLIVLTGLYIVFAYFVFYRILGQVSTTEQIALNMVLAIVLAFSFQPIKKFFDRLTNKLFYKEMYSTEEFYSRINEAMTSTVALRRLLEVLSNLIANTLKSETAGFSVYTSESSLINVGTEKYKKIPRDDLEVFREFRSPLLIDDPEISPPTRRLMISHRISAIVPLWRDDVLIGYLYLGEHRTSHYSHRDFKVLQAVSGELVIGIQNSLSVQEVRDLNTNLQQRIDSATKELRQSNAQLQKLDEAKDEFISMASHQLRTPLTSIKGYLSMLIEGDMGQVTGQQKKVLQEAFVSSERMVRLIGDFLNVSRLQTGKFIVEKHLVDFALLVDREVDALQQNAISHGLKFKYVKPKGIPKLNIDENKIQQVVMNFLDNAIYYSKEGDSIAVSVELVDGGVEFTVRDTGIGVPKEEQAGLFNKFYRASNARRQRPDGTGVGLFLAKKVVRDHGGRIIFESEEGKGSTFGFRLPLPKA